MAERRHQRERIPHQVQKAKGSKIAVVVRIPSGRATVAAPVRRHDMETGGGERHHYLPPGIGELREAVEQQHARPSRRIEARLQQVNPQAGDVIDEARPYAGRKRRTVQRGLRGHGVTRPMP